MLCDLFTLFWSYLLLFRSLFSVPVLLFSHCSSCFLQWCLAVHPRRHYLYAILLSSHLVCFICSYNVPCFYTYKNHFASFPCFYFLFLSQQSAISPQFSFPAPCLPSPPIGSSVIRTGHLTSLGALRHPWCFSRGWQYVSGTDAADNLRLPRRACGPWSASLGSKMVTPVVFGGTLVEILHG